MKSQTFKVKAFALLIVMGLSLSAFSLFEKEESSFLETHKGSLWKIGNPEEGLTIYAQINKLESNPIEIWLYNVIDDCFLYEKVSDSGLTEVIENGKDKMQIRIEENNDNYGIFTMSVVHNVLNVELDSFEKGKLIRQERFTLDRTEENAEDLVVCKNYE